MARSQVFVLFALLGLFLSSTTATISYSNISNTVDCIPSLFFNNGTSILCQPQSDYFVSITLNPPSIGQSFIVCDTSSDPYFDPYGNLVCLGLQSSLNNGTNIYSLYNVNPISGGYQESASSYLATYTKFKSSYVMLAVENNTVNNSFINAQVLYTNTNGGAAPIPYCSFSVANYTEVEDFTIYEYTDQIFVLALMANGSYDVLNVNCSTGVGNVTTNFYQPPTNNSPVATHGGIDLFYSPLGNIPFLLVFDPYNPQPISLTTLGNQNNATNIPSRSIKKVLPINSTTFVTYTTCSITMYTFTSTSNATKANEFPFGCWYFKAQFIAYSNLFYIDDGINYFFLNISTFLLSNIYSLNPVIPLADGSTIYLDRNGYFVQNVTSGNINFTSIGLAFSPYTFYVTPPYTTYYMLGNRAGGNAFLVTVDVTANTVTELQLPGDLASVIDQKIFGVVSSNPDNLILAASGSQSAYTVVLWCNNTATNFDNPKDYIPFIDANNCSLTLVNPNTAQFKYNETVYATTSGSTIQLVNVNGGATLQTITTTISSDIISECNWGAFDAVPTPGATVIVNGFFATCGPEGSDNYLISEYGDNETLPGNAQGFIQIFANNSFQYCVPSSEYPEVNYCQLSNVTSWGSVPVGPSNNGGGGAWVVILLLLLALGGGGAYYWFYYRPRHSAGKFTQADNYQPFARGGNTSIEHSNE